MESNLNIEKIYELLEQFDFQALSDENKKYVLEIMPESEYMTMRKTIIEAQNYFASNEPVSKNNSIKKEIKQNKFLLLLKQPIPLYKIAAIIILFLGIFSIFQIQFHQKNIDSLASIDTIFINKIDTILVHISDTITVIKENKNSILSIQTPIQKINPISLSQFNAIADIHPNDYEQIKMFETKNSLSNDSLLTDCLVSWNF